MKPEDICVSLDMARRLKEAGWPQEAIWFWTVTGQDEPFLYGAKRDGTQPTLTPPSSTREYFAAPTAEELLRRLPPSMLHRNRRDMFRMQIRLTPRQHWQIGYATSKADWVFKEGIAAMEEADTLANAAAAMYCYLAEQGLLPAA